MRSSRIKAVKVQYVGLSSKFTPRQGAEIGPVGVAVAIWREAGFLGFFRGWTAACELLVLGVLGFAFGLDLVVGQRPLQVLFCSSGNS